MSLQIESMLDFRLRRFSQSGDNEAAMAYMRQFLEMERQAKLSSAALKSDGLAKICKLPKTLPVQ